MTGVGRMTAEIRFCIEFACELSEGLQPLWLALVIRTRALIKSIVFLFHPNSEAEDLHSESYPHGAELIRHAYVIRLLGGAKLLLI